MTLRSGAACRRNMLTRCFSISLLFACGWCWGSDVESKVSLLSLPDGTQAIVFGMPGLSVADFHATGPSGRLVCQKKEIIDAEKPTPPSVADDWCQQLTEVNLCVWTGWAQYVGFTNEDAMAEYLFAHPSRFKESDSVLKWVLECAGSSVDDWDVVKWTKSQSLLCSELVNRTKDGGSLVYLQMTFLDGTGSHAVTCCGYQLAAGRDGTLPSDLVGVFIVDSDNDKRTAGGGRAAPNSVTLVSVSWNSVGERYELDYPEHISTIKFLCYVAKNPNPLGARVLVEGASIPYCWLREVGAFDLLGELSADQAAWQTRGKRDGQGQLLPIWQDYVAGTDPTDEKDVFRASITIVDGKVTISYSPELDDARKAMRKYTTWGKKSLMDTKWTEVQDGHEAEFNFFKVSVEMR